MLNSTGKNARLLRQYLILQLGMTLGFAVIVWFFNAQWVKYAIVGGGIAVIGNLVFGILLLVDVPSGDQFFLGKMMVAEFIKYLLVIILLGIAIAWLRPALGPEGIILPGVFFVVYLLPIFVGLAKKDL